MATIGRGILSASVFEFFEGLRTFDPERACRILAENAAFESPWNEGQLTGRDAILAFLKEWLEDPQRRPSFTIIDVEGDGNLVHLHLSVSGRFGRRPQQVRMSILDLQGTLHHVLVRPRVAVAH